MIKLPRRMLCLDWDKRSLRMVVVRIGAGKTSLEDAHSHRLPAGVDSADPKAMGEFIAKMMKRHRWHHKRVIINVPRERAVINTLPLAPTPADELAAAVRFQAMKELPFPIDDAVVDFAITARASKNTIIEVLIAAVRNDTLARLRETCHEAGLTPVRIGLRPYANVVSVLGTRETSGRRVLFVDVGPALTEIDIITEEVLAFSRSANVSVPLPHSSEVVEGEDSRISSKAVLEDVEAADQGMDQACDALLVEITRTIQAYRANEPSAAISEIVVAGGTGIEARLAEAIGKRFKLRCSLFDATRMVGVESHRGTDLRSFSAALGLAFGLSKDGRLEIDFLNPKKPIPPRQNLKRRLRISAVAAAMVLICGAAWGATRYIEKQRRLRTLRSEIAALTREVKERIEIHNKVDEVDEWSRQGVWLDVLLTLSEMADMPRDEMRSSKIAFAQSTSRVTLKLYSSTMEMPTEFVARINENEAFSATQRNWQNYSGREDYKGHVEVNIELVELKKFREEQKKRERERRDRLKKL